MTPTHAESARQLIEQWRTSLVTGWLHGTNNTVESGPSEIARAIRRQCADELAALLAVPDPGEAPVRETAPAWPTRVDIDLTDALTCYSRWKAHPAAALHVDLCSALDDLLVSYKTHRASSPVIAAPSGPQETP